MLRKIDSIERFAADARYDVAVLRVSEQTAESRHGHGFLEIVIVEKGRAMHVTEGGSHTVGRGDVFILNPSRSHAYRHPRGFSIVNVLVRESFVRQQEAELGVLAGYQTLFNLLPYPLENGSYSNRIHLDETALVLVLDFAGKIEGFCKSTRPEGPVFCHAWGRLLLAQLAAECEQSVDDSQQTALARAIAKVEQSIMEPLALADIVSQSGMSERTLLRRFREATGRSPIQHQTHCRLRQACKLLANSELNVTEIAMSCGFQDSNYFTRQFTKVHGVSPRQWRSALP